MICPNCKTQIDKESKFCPECGYDFQQKNKQGSKKISNDKKFYITLAVVFVMFLFWLYAPSKNQTNTHSPMTSSSQSKSNKPAKTLESEGAQDVDVAVPFSVDGQGEINLQNVEFIGDVVPSKKRSIYTHYKAETGKVYCVVNVILKNLGKEKADASKIADVTVLYDTGEYKYNCMAIIERHGDLEGALYTSIDPLNPEKMKYAVQMPEDVQNNGKPIKILFAINGKKFVYNYR